jgi:AraC family transcriptional regulator
MEQHLEDEITAEDVAREVALSPFFLQRGFSLMTGYTIGEYLRNRRLYLAAQELQNTDEKIIDLAFRYCYETPESFTKAFSRFHGASPSQVRAGSKAKSFLPLTIKISVQGGAQISYKVVSKFGFKVIGFQKEFSNETAYEEIPKFWDEIFEKYGNNVYAGKEPKNPYEKAIAENSIGEYGICIDDLDGDKFRYLVAGKYVGGEIPEGMIVYEFPKADWAIFNCIGKIPESLQSMNTRIFTEWLPGNPDYEICGNANVEWYDINNEMNDPEYHSAIWIPVKKKD